MPDTLPGHAAHRTVRQNGVSMFFDLAGIGLGGVCLVHCTLLPLAVSLAPVLLGSLAGDRWFHIGLLVLILPLALAAFAVGWRRHHSLAMVVFGSLGVLGLVFAAVLGHDLLGTAGEKILTSASGVTLALGHFINFRRRRAKNCCPEPGLFMTPSTATAPCTASATFHSVAHPHRTVKYVSGVLGREMPQLQGLEPSRDERVMNNPGCGDLIRR